MPLADHAGQLAGLMDVSSSGNIGTYPRLLEPGLSWGLGQPGPLCLVTYGDLSLAVLANRAVGHETLLCVGRNDAIVKKGHLARTRPGSTVTLVVPYRDTNLVPAIGPILTDIAMPPGKLPWADLAEILGDEAVRRCVDDPEVFVPGAGGRGEFIVRESGLWSSDPVLHDMARRLGSSIVIEALCRNLDGEHWAYLTTFKDIDGRWKRTLLAAEVLRLQPRKVLSILLTAGYELGACRGAGDDLVRFLQTFGATQRLRIVNQLGWHGQHYVTKKITCGPPAYDMPIHERALGGHIRPTSPASATEWTSLVAPLAVGNSRLILSICAALAGACIGLVPAQGSFGIHLRGHSSTGKTTCLEVAASIWGDPTTEVRSWRSTGAGLEALASEHSDRLLVLDELAQIEARDAAEAAYLLGNGSGRARADQRGKGVPTASWRLVFISSGEITLQEKIDEWSRAPAGRDGQAVRVLDVPADAGQGYGIFDVLHERASGAALSNELKRICRQSSGALASAFIAKVVDDVPSARQFLEQAQAAFVSNILRDDADGVTRRAVANIGFLAAVGELAIGLGVLPWRAGEANAALARCADDWLKKRKAPSSSLLDDIRARLTASEIHLEQWGSQQDAPDGCWGYQRGDLLYILPSAWPQLCAGLDRRQVARLLHQRGCLLAKTGRFQTIHRRPGATPRRFYRIDLAALARLA